MVQRFLTFLRGRNRNEILLLGGIAAVCACLWIFVEIAEEAGEPEHAHLEERILRSFRRPDDPGRFIGPDCIAPLPHAISWLGGPVATALVVALVAGYLVFRRQNAAAILIILAAAGGSLLSIGLKHTFARPRPTVVPLLDQVSDASFPSGHSLISAVVYITLGALLAQTTQRWMGKVTWIGAGLLLSALIGFSRMMLGVHYPTDVLAGWTAGTGWAIICSVALDHIQARRTG